MTIGTKWQFFLLEARLYSDFKDFALVSFTTLYYCGNSYDELNFVIQCNLAAYNC